MSQTIIKPTFNLNVVGCKVNQVEAAMLKQQFESQGFTYVEDKADASLVILHTCTVTHKADRDCRRLIDQVEKNYPHAYVIVTGCLAALESAELAKHPKVLTVIDQDNRYRSVAIAMEKIKEQGLVIQNLHNGFTDHHDRGFFQPTVEVPYTGRARAFIKVQDGCNGVCTYCRVRLARGLSSSREQQAIISEIQAYLDQGYQEVVLTGVNLASYEPGLDHLLEEINQLTGQFRIRLSSIEPQYLTQSLMEKLVEYQSWLCPHVHIPIQSGSNKLLAAMKRPYTREVLQEKLLWLNKHWPRLTITADLIIGFPDEQQEDYDQSVQLAKELNLSKIHVFPFSARPGTEAATMAKQVVNRVISSRAKKMRLLSDDLQKQHINQFIGQEVEVLLEQQDGHGYWLGTTGEYEKAKIKINGRAGQLVNATISEIEGNMLIGL